MSPALGYAGLIPFVHARFASSQKTSMRGARGGNSRRGGSFGVLLDPHLGNSEGEADAALRLVRLHGVAGENRKDSACRMVELRTTSGVGNSSATEAVSRLSWGGCSMRRTWGTRRSIFPAASRRAVNRDMAVGSIIFTANNSFLSKQFYSRL